MRYVSVIALAFLLAKVAKVCGALHNVLQQQDLMGKKADAIIGGSCPEAGKFHECL